MRLTGYRFQTSLISRRGERVWRGRGSLYSEAVFSGPTFHSAVKTPGPPDFQFKKKNKYCLLSLQRIRRLSPVEQNWKSYRGSTRKKKKKSKPEVRGRRESSLIRSTDVKPRAGQAPSRGNPSRLAGGSAPVTRDSPRTDQSPRPGPPPARRRTHPVSALPGLLPDGGRLPPTPRAAPDSSRGAARPARPRCPRFPPPPRLPANARDTASRQPPTALTLFGERTNTLEATASPPPPSARPTPAHAHAGSALPGSWDARAARREGEFSPRRSSAPPPAGGDMEAGVRALVQPSSAGKPLRSPPRLLPVRSSLR